MTFDQIIRDTFPTDTELTDFTRGALSAAWADELHPSTAASVRIARHKLACLANNPESHKGE